MIAVTRDNAAGLLLARLVAEPGELTAEALAEVLHPEPRHQGPFTGASYKAHVAALKAHRDAADKRRAKVSALLHRLQQAGLVEKIQPVRIAPGFERVVAKRGDADELLAEPAAQVDDRALWRRMVPMVSPDEGARLVAADVGAGEATHARHPSTSAIPFALGHRLAGVTSTPQSPSSPYTFHRHPPPSARPARSAAEPGADRTSSSTSR